jgi:arsenate reductase
MVFPLARRLLAEFLGTGLLVVAVVGSGIMASRLSPNDVGLELFENATATAAALVALILCLGSVSGAHFNPLVTLADAGFGGLPLSEAGGYVGAQVAGAVAGAWVANGMFGLATFEWAARTRSSGPLWASEVVATFGLLLVIFGVVRSGRASATPFAVGAYIGAAYFFTASTSFANPAVTVGRMFSNSFAGIKPSSVPAYVGFELIGATLAVAAIRLLYPQMPDSAANVIVPHSPPQPAGRGHVVTGSSTKGGPR